MTPDEFRENGYAVVDWIADYLEEVESYPVLSTVEPGEIAAMLPDHAPAGGEPFDALLSDLDRVVMPGITHWQSPGWFAYFPANSSPPSVLAEFVSAGLGVQGMLWSTSPAVTEIETRVLDWLVEMLGLPTSWRSDGPGGGVIQMSASDATHAALVVARHTRSADAPSEQMVVYVSDQAHSSIEKGCTVAGIGHCVKIPTDTDFAMDTDALEQAIAADIAAGLTPICVVSAIGTTATTAVDPIRRIGEIAERSGMWHHVDAAYAGTAMVCEEFRYHQDGLELAHSYTFNPHKWMMVNFDCNVLWVADRGPLIDTMSILPPYLRNEASDGGDVIDYRDWHVPLGRRFRALKLWWVIRSYGVDGIQRMVREHVRLANRVATWVDNDERLDLVAPHPFGLVCFAHREGNEATRQLGSALNATGEVAVTPSHIDDSWFVRVSVGQARTELAHVDRLLELIDQMA
ncbi:MAG: aminotransferase class I/II-fold pyridoxal phosphate-dependent enzyme [Proteobacteria bacterium]|nr:aminotransferase class I/II-fold pyridoxal phosphate-dependent enzyme [Pseudomonadota bacterium]